MSRASEKCGTLSSAAANVYWEYPRREGKGAGKNMQGNDCKLHTFIEKQKPVGPGSSTISK